MAALSPDPGSQDRNPTPFLRVFALTGGVVVFIPVMERNAFESVGRGLTVQPVEHP